MGDNRPLVEALAGMGLPALPGLDDALADAVVDTIDRFERDPGSWFPRLCLPETEEIWPGQWRARATWPADLPIWRDAEAEEHSARLWRLVRMSEKLAVRGGQGRIDRRDRLQRAAKDHDRRAQVAWPDEKPHWVTIEPTGEITCDGMERREWSALDLIAIARGYICDDGTFDTERAAAFLCGIPDPGPPSRRAAPVVQDDPVDLWGIFPPPDLPKGLLPPIIENFATITGDRMGADPAGLAVAALVTCAAATDDKMMLQVKRHDPTWLESARIWAALVGNPSTKKSPIITAATAPLLALDRQMFREWKADEAIFWALPKEERQGKTPPPQRRLRIEDATVEAAQIVLEGSPWGVLLLQDELSGFFGAMDKYSGGKGAAADRAFWLRAFNGGEFALNRVGRGSSLLPNLSVCLLGGIQPEPIRKVAADAHDDGLLQRLFPIILKPATIGRDEPAPPVADDYAATVCRLRQMRVTGYGGPVHLDDDAQAVRRRLEERHLALQASEAVSRKLASHVGKYDGLFARLCLLWACIEATGTEPPATIDGATAERVAAFLHGFLLRHAAAFYGGVLGLSDDHDRLQAVAGYILTHRLARITNRDVQRGDRTMRAIKEADIRPILEQLAALGWLDRIEGPRPSSAPHWTVNPAVHRKFADRAEAEAKRRTEARAAILDMVGGDHG